MDDQRELGQWMMWIGGTLLVLGLYGRQWVAAGLGGALTEWGFILFKFHFWVVTSYIGVGLFFVWESRRP